MTDRLTAVHEGGHAMVAYALYGCGALDFIHLSGRNKWTRVHPPSLQKPQQKLLNGQRSPLQRVGQSEVDEANGCFGLGGLAAQTVVLPSPVNWGNGIDDLKRVVRLSADPAACDVQHYAEQQQPYCDWFDQAVQFFRQHLAQLDQFAQVLEPRNGYVSGDDIDTELQRILCW